MSAFNLVSSKNICPVCGELGDFLVQFKFGNTWQLKYKVGDFIKWGGNDIGTPGIRRVRVEGIGGPCPHCKTDNFEFDIFVSEDRIECVKMVGLVRECDCPEGFQIIEK